MLPGDMGTTGVRPMDDCATVDTAGQEICDRNARGAGLILRFALIVLIRMDCSDRLCRDQQQNDGCQQSFLTHRAHA